jgi:hypothetical protein
MVTRTQASLPMTDLAKPLAVRLIRDFSHFPPTGITVNWRAGQVIGEPAVIALLTGINAPIEPIEVDPTRPPPIPQIGSVNLKTQKEQL